MSSAIVGSDNVSVLERYLAAIGVTASKRAVAKPPRARTAADAIPAMPIGAGMAQWVAKRTTAMSAQDRNDTRLPN